MPDEEGKEPESLASRAGQRLFVLFFLLFVVGIIAGMVVLCFGTLGIGEEAVPVEVITVAVDPEQLAALCIAIVIAGMMAGN